MTWTLTLPYERPPAGLHANDRNHRMVRARSTKEVRETVFWLCRAQSIPKMQRVSVQIVWVVPTRHKRDTDGPEGLCKAIFDAIGSDRGVSAHIVPDDSPEFMDKPRLVIEHQPGVTAHFRVEITDISNPFRPDAVDGIAERL
jgi:hypothetical protein